MAWRRRAKQDAPATAKLYGIMPHPGQAFYFVCMDARTGKWIFTPLAEGGYNGNPEVTLLPPGRGDIFVARVKDRQDFELRVMDGTKGRHLHTVKVKGSGDYGVAGRASAAVQNGSVALFGNKKIRIAGK